MNHRPQNDHLRINKNGKYIRKNIFHQVHFNANAISQPPQPKTQVYIIDKKDFKSVVQQLTGYQSCESSPQNLPQRQKIRPEPINRTSPVPPNAIAVQEDLHASLCRRYLESLLEDSSESNGDQFQQPFDEYQSHMLAQPQVPIQSMSCSNGLEPVNMTTTLTSPRFDGSPQQMDGAYSFSSTVEYNQPLTANLTFSSMTQPEDFDFDIAHLC
ncbi:unnamed protein product [Thlaspi arvense]|uniref:VQ domain-containing protein n=1 Tax=Thlaspi arvense TaxID=13288 RepID=A0AAU9RBG6_THLAR|nr:unnamed protein product [Thlaspi arvense]